MLRQVLEELKTARGPVNMNDLARQLGVDRDVLESMIEFWVRKGRLQDDDQALAAILETCTGGDCAGSCPGPQACPFVMKMPRTFSLPSDDL
jgi:hypothetical protein